MQFVSEFSGGGSGALTRLAYWRYDQGEDRFMPAGDIVLTEQGEYRLEPDWLITADAQPAEGETHFAPHRFVISVYNYLPEQGFAETVRYRTARKYPSLDDVDKIDIISQEMEQIL